jgi:hypothetical protein
MPYTRRRLVSRPRYASFNDEAVRLFARATELKRRTTEYNRVAAELARALNRRPWDADVLTVDADSPPPESDFIRFASWESALALRRALEQAIEECHPDHPRRALAEAKAVEPSQ